MACLGKGSRHREVAFLPQREDTRSHCHVEVVTSDKRFAQWPPVDAKTMQQPEEAEALSSDRAFHVPVQPVLFFSDELSGWGVGIRAMSSEAT